jgi:hypothetical protein
MNIPCKNTEHKHDNPYNQESRTPKSNRWMIGFVGLMYVGLGFGCLMAGILAFIGNPMEYLLLGREGVPTNGVITEKRHKKSERLLRSDRHSYYITYEYTALVNGALVQFEAEDEISQSSYYKYQVGQTIELLYAASDPQISAVNAGLGTVSENSIIILLAGAASAVWFANTGLTTLYDEFATQRGS